VAAAVDLAEQWDTVYARLNQGDYEPKLAGSVQSEDSLAWTDASGEVTEHVEIERGRAYEDASDPPRSDDGADDASASEPEPQEGTVDAGPVDGDSPGRPDIADLLERAMSSTSLRAHDLARTVQHHLEEIRYILALEEQAEPLREQIAQLRAELEAKEDALAAILGPRRARPAVRAACAAAKPLDRSLFYSREVREWAQANNHKVGERGQIAKHIVEAYLDAHREPAAI
jgi:hypothetical protein